MDIMNYTYEFCINEDNITQGELKDVIEELMDQELNTICEDGSVSEICKHLLRYKEMSLLGQYAMIEEELNKLQGKDWLRPDVKLTYTPSDGDSSSESRSESDNSDIDDELMDFESNQQSGSECKGIQSNKQNADTVQSEDGWTTVRNKKR
ncbi:hypothetical protein EVAR_72813_1 [Eumeta japonica]|uniref:Pre-rRNA-processing protein TSR2 homolog n=1 Tax=Eumeta variegata TaxID=151549 RepID=A0A4C1SYC8_EUMVA|nr:hypothetical protein EVAR_72813_1 [Eumeta japonica]